jgi:D-alanyl-D-alanine carboxypeptidase (penicillin-binding protein 5/6)
MKQCGSAVVGQGLVALAAGIVLAAAATGAGAEARPAARRTPAGPPYRAAVLMEVNTGEVLFEDNAHEQRPPASMTKMMLMLLVAEKVDAGEIHWDDKVTVSREAEKMGGSQVYLAAGETFTLAELMQAIVIHSANDASLAVAEVVGGSRDAFVDLMNERAQQLGLKDTVYRSPHGLPPGKEQEPDLTSALDLAVLGRELLKHRQIMEWADTVEAPFRNGAFQMVNTNHLVRTTPWVTGLKTGYTREAGFGVTASGERNKMKLIAVIMGSATKKGCFDEAARLFNKGFNGFQPVFAVRKGDVVASDVPVKYGNPRFVRVVAGDDLSFVTQKGMKRNFSLELSLPGELQAPLDPATQVGAVVIREDGREVGQVPALAGDPVQKQQRFWERFF